MNNYDFCLLIIVDEKLDPKIYPFFSNYKVCMPISSESFETLKYAKTRLRLIL